MKRVYIEGLGLVEGHFSGVGQYILGVLRGIDQLLDDAQYAGVPMPEVKVIIPYNTVGKFQSYGFKHIGYKRFPLSFRVMSILWYRGKLPPIDLWCGKGAYIFTRFVGMPLWFNKSATVIYDLSYELYRQYSDERNAKFLSKRVKQTLGSNHKIITISQNAKKEIVDFYKLKPEEVVIATPATDPRLFYRRSEKEIAKVKQKYGITGDYILALSNLEPRKNLSALVDAYCRLPKEITDEVGLLLVGVNGWKTEKLFQDIVQRVENGYNIMRPSHYVHDDDKPAMISGAKMLVYPSHYEGFGMPPLEALACGVPVISADNSSLPEVMGDAGKMVNVEKPDALLQAIEEYWKNGDKITEQTKSNGPKQAQEFSWTKSAQTFLDLAEEMMS
jgi:alpha-1,3-rhamnosyl/mannosyltransferase